MRPGGWPRNGVYRDTATERSRFNMRPARFRRRRHWVRVPGAIGCVRYQLTPAVCSGNVSVNTTFTGNGDTNANENNSYF